MVVSSTRQEINKKRAPRVNGPASASIAMQNFLDKDLATDLDDGFALVALPSTEGTTPPPVGLALCVVVRATADPAAGHFVVVRETPQGRVLLGCTADAAARPQEWLELWVQKTDFHSGSQVGQGARLTNAVWDARWRDLAAVWRRIEPASVLATPLESGHLAPAVLDAGGARFVPLSDPWSGARLQLCTDERLLADAGLPGYAASPHRYLHGPDADAAAARFFRVRPDAPANERTVDLTAALPDAVQAPTLGLDGAAVVVRRFAPLSVEEFSDVAGGRAYKGMDNARRIFRVPGVYRLLEDEDAMRCGSAHLFTVAQGRTGRLAEAIYLKLQITSQLLRRVRDHTAQNQLPFLNLTAESFRVRLGATGFGLPFLWTAQADLARPGGAFAHGHRVEPSAEQQQQARQPRPSQQDDQAGERLIALAVARVLHVHAEERRGHQPAHAEEDGAGQRLPDGLVHLGRQQVERQGQDRQGQSDDRVFQSGDEFLQGHVQLLSAMRAICSPKTMALNEKKLVSPNQKSSSMAMIQRFHQERFGSLMPKQ